MSPPQPSLQAQPPYKAQSEPEGAHAAALQYLSDGKDISYDRTLRVVTHDGNNSAKQPYTKTRKPPVRRSVCHH